MCDRKVPPQFVPGQHICHAYASAREALDTLTDRALAALSADAAFVVNVPRGVARQLQARLREAGVDPELARDQQRLIIQDARAFYAPGEIFDPDVLMSAWQELYDRLRAAGIERVSIAGQVPVPVGRLAGSERLAEYEARFDEFNRKHGTSTLCQYDRRRFNPLLLQQVLLCHEQVLVDGCLYPNVNYIPHQSFRRRDPARVMLDAFIESMKRASDTHETLVKSEERYRLVADFTYDWETWMDPEGRLLYTSPSCERISGYTAEEFMADPGLFDRIVHPEDQHIWAAHERTCSSASDAPLEFRIIRRDGLTRWISHHCQPIYGDDGVFRGRRASNRDVTMLAESREIERALLQRVEHERQVFRSVFDNAGVGVALTDLSGRIVEANAALARMLGREGEELSGLSIADLTQPDDYQAELARARDLVTGKIDSFTIEKRYVRADGSMMWGQLSLSLIREQGQPVYAIGVVMDITARVAAEQAIDQLLADSQDRAAQLQTILASNPDGVAVYDIEGRITAINEAGRRILGNPPPEWADLSADERLRQMDFRDEEGRPLSEGLSLMTQVRRGEVISGMLVSLNRADGERVWLTISVAPLRNERGEIYGAVSVFSDITPVRRLQEELKRRAAEVEAIVSSMADGVVVYDAEGRIERMNAAARKLLRYDDGMLDKPILERLEGTQGFDESLQPVPPDQSPAARALRGEVIRNQVTRLIFPDGRSLWMSASVAPIRGEDGRVERAVAVYRDVTDQRAASDRLEAERERAAGHAAALDLVISSIADAVSICDATGRLVRINDAARRLLRYDDRDIYEERVARCGYRHADGSAFAFEDLPLSRALRGEVVTAETIQLAWPDGTSTWVHSSAAPLRNSEGEITGAVLTNTDLTTLYELGERVEQERRKLFTVLGLLPGYVCVLTPDHDFDYVNPRFIELFGDPADRKCYEALFGRDVPCEECHSFDCLQQGQPVVWEWLGPTGRTFEIHDYPFSSPTGAPLVLEFGIDITERKHDQQQIEALAQAAQQQAQELETILSSIADGVIIYSADGEVLRMNEAAGRILGAYAEDEAKHIGERRSAMVARDEQGHPLPLERLPSVRAMNGELVVGQVTQIPQPDGRVIWYSTSSAPVRDENGVVTAVATVFRDITEERLVEQELARHRDDLQALVDERTRKLVDYQNRLRQLAAELSMAEEHERKRIAAAIHDTISQSLAFARIRIGLLSREAAEEGHIELLQSLDALISETIEASRNLMYDLSPPVLYEMEFAAALQWLGQRMHELHGFEVTVTAEGDCSPLPQELRVVLFQSAQELLTNAAKYARASRISVNLQCLDHGLVLELQDDGVGFEPGELRVTREGGFGLFHIRERLVHLGGSLEIESSPGEGALFRLRLPLTAENQDSGSP